MTWAHGSSCFLSSLGSKVASWTRSRAGRTPDDLHGIAAQKKEKKRGKGPKGFQKTCCRRNEARCLCCVALHKTQLRTPSNMLKPLL
jgi:hypothetical protein